MFCVLVPSESIDSLIQVGYVTGNTALQIVPIPMPLHSESLLHQLQKGKTKIPHMYAYYQQNQQMHINGKCAFATSFRCAF